jgi:hypothetical protein
MPTLKRVGRYNRAMRRLGLLIGLLWWLAYADSYQPLLNHERMTQLFMEMARIESGSENEAAMCEFVAKHLRELGAETVIIDEASKQIGGTGGNVFARFPGTVNAPPLLLNAHVDTVYSTEGIQLIRDETEIRTDGKTILGADNKAGVAIILEVIAHAQGAQTARARRWRWSSPSARRRGCWARRRSTRRQLRARTGLVVDGREDPSALFVQSPTHWKWEVVFHRQGGARRRGTRKGQERHRDGCQSDCPDGVGTLGRRDDRQCRRY